MWDTIHAISTPEGIGLMGIIRISGPETLAIVQKLSPKTALDSWPNFTKGPFPLSLPHFQKIPGVLFLMKAPKSYTCEDMAELHLPGSIPILQNLSSELTSQGARLANPGEFTQRAFLNGRLSLAQAEGILELIHAEDQAQVKAALHQLSGRFSEEINYLRQEITLLLAKIEANIDFSYHGDVEIDPKEIPNSLQKIKTSLLTIASQQAKRPQRTQGITVALIGPPNAGKSTLFNQLSGQEHAITSKMAGTTRDVLEAEFSWKDYNFCLYDTAGIEEEISEDIITNKAQEFRNRIQQTTQVCLFVSSIDTLTEPYIKAAFELIPNEKLFLINKSDLPHKIQSPINPFYPISAKTGEGLTALKEALVTLVSKSPKSSAGYGYLLNARHQAALTESLACVQRANEIQVSELDFIAFELREAADHLASITGEIVSEDILDQIFSQFCIGK